MLAIAGVSAGLAAGFAERGLPGVAQAAVGAAAGFSIMLLFYLGGALGAGDVKLFAAIGALSGIWLALSIITYSILSAGIIAVVILINKRQLLARAKQMLHALIGFICLKRLHLPKQDMIRFPFLLAVIPGVAAALWELWGKGDLG
ncbi:MAG: peptidase [Paenibacillaceae bacterium]|nr:peptidase [Paenibacillaceae bacterium]